MTIGQETNPKWYVSVLIMRKLISIDSVINLEKKLSQPNHTHAIIYGGLSLTQKIFNVIFNEEYK